jgi:hypothetical protein
MRLISAVSGVRVPAPPPRYAKFPHFISTPMYDYAIATVCSAILLISNFNIYDVRVVSASPDISGVL